MNAFLDMKSSLWTAGYSMVVTTLEVVVELEVK